MREFNSGGGDVMRAFFSTILVLVISMMLLPAGAHAGLVEDAWGVATDPLKLGKAGDSAVQVAASIERTVRELQDLEGKTNLDVRDRMDQMRQIVEGLQTAVSQNVENLGAIADASLTRVSAIEAQTNLDAINLIYRAQCLAQGVVDQQIPKAIQEALDRLNQSEPGISFLGIKILKFKAKSVPLDDPDIAYRTLRAGYFERLDALKPDADPYWIVSAYGNLERLARLARCNYIDQPANVLYFDREINDLERLSRPWSNFVKL